MLSVLETSASSVPVKGRHARTGVPWPTLPRNHAERLQLQRKQPILPARPSIPIPEQRQLQCIRVGFTQFKLALRDQSSAQPKRPKAKESSCSQMILTTPCLSTPTMMILGLNRVQRSTGETLQCRSALSAPQLQRSMHGPGWAGSTTSLPSTLPPSAQHLCQPGHLLRIPMLRGLARQTTPLKPTWGCIPRRQKPRAVMAGAAHVCMLCLRAFDTNGCTRARVTYASKHGSDGRGSIAPSRPWRGSQGRALPAPACHQHPRFATLCCAPSAAGWR